MAFYSSDYRVKEEVKHLLSALKAGYFIHPAKSGIPRSKPSSIPPSMLTSVLPLRPGPRIEVEMGGMAAVQPAPEY